MPEVAFESSTLEKVAVLQPGINVSIDAFGSGLPYVTVQDLYDGTRIPVDRLRLVEVPASQVERFRLKDGDIVIGKSSVKLEGIGYPSRFRDAESKVLFSGFTLRVQADESLVDGEYLFYWLRSPGLRRWIIANAQRSALTNLNSSIIRRIPVKYPNLQAQQRIAEILSTVDKAIEQTEALIAKTRQIKAGLMHDLFTRGVTPDGQLRPTREEAPQLYKESPLGWVPKEWNVTPLEKLLIGGLKNGYFKRPELVGEGYKLINVSELYQEFGIDTDHQDVERVAAESADASTYSTEPGDLFFTRSSLVLAGIAKCNILLSRNEPTLFECHVIRARPDKELIDPPFLARYFQTDPVRRELMARAKTTTMTTISQPDIRTIPVNLPSLSEQQIVSERAMQTDSTIREEEKELLKLHQQKAGLMSDLLSGRVGVSK